MENKRILVIGGKGYVGKPIVELLSNAGYTVTVLSRTGKSQANGVTAVKGDVLDKEALADSIKDSMFDLVVYLAGVVRTLRKSKYKENEIGIKNTIEVMKQKEIKKILYFSTQNVLLPSLGPYSLSKKNSEEIVKECGLDYVIKMIFISLQK